MKQNITYRLGLPEDMEAIRRVNVAAARSGGAGYYPQKIIDAWTGPLMDWYYPDIFNEHQPKSITIVALDKNHVCGVGRYRDGEIYMLFIDPDYMGKGIGREILSRMEQEAVLKHGHHEVRVLSTLNAVPFYQKHGYAGDITDGYEVAPGLFLECRRMIKKLAN